METDQRELGEMTWPLPESHPVLKQQGSIPWTGLAVPPVLLGLFVETPFLSLPSGLGSTLS